MSGAIYVFGLCIVTCPEDISLTDKELALVQTTGNGKDPLLFCLES